MKIFLRTATFSLVLLTALELSAAPVTVIDQSFNGLNGGNPSLNYGFGAGTGFSVSNGTVDLIGNGNYAAYDYMPGNGMYVDMDGTSGDAGRLQSDSLTLDPGLYTLSFDLAGSQRPTGPLGPNGATDSVTVTFDGFAPDTFTLGVDDPFQTFTLTYNVGSPTTGTLSFEDLTGDDNLGLLLDNILLQYDASANSVAVPEPASVALWALGCLGFLPYFGSRRRNSVQQA